MLKGDKKKEYQRDYMRAKRSNKSVELGAGDVRPFRKEAFAMLDPSGKEYPAIIYALTDPIKREKLEKIHHSLNEFKVADKVYYGISGIPFDVVGDLLEATK